MKYPKTLNVKVENIFGDQDVQITLYSGLTIFVGTNASDANIKKNKRHYEK